MTKLEYTFKNDTLFKVLFVKYPELLKRLVADLLEIRFESIDQFVITNPEMPAERIGDKFCRLDINMIVDGRRVNLEIQVRDEGDFPERSLFYWAREYSTALSEGEDFSSLPRTIIISIVDFNLFDCVEFHSEYQALEVTRHTTLTDKMSLHYFELPKLPRSVSAVSGKELWLWGGNRNVVGILAAIIVHLPERPVRSFIVIRYRDNIRVTLLVLRGGKPHALKRIPHGRFVRQKHDLYFCLLLLMLSHNSNYTESLTQISLRQSASSHSYISVRL